MEFISKNPFNGELLKQFGAHTPNQLQVMVDKAFLEFYQWRKFSFSERGGYFLSLASVLENRKESLARTITLEMGKTLKEAKAELDKTIQCCRYYAQNAEKLLESKHLAGKDMVANVIFQPLGVIFGVFPWNYPFWQVFRFAIPTLMAGNTAVFKHAPNVPQCALEIESCFNEAGFPQSVLQSAFARIDELEGIVAHPSIKAVTLTGSERAGSSLAALAGKYIKKSVMELGGSDPFVVLDGADMETTVKMAVKSRFQNSGQSCVAAKRFILKKSISDEFLEGFITGIKKLKIGNPLEDVDMGTMARADLTDKLEQQVDETLQHGAKLLLGGKRFSDTVYEPTVITNIKAFSPAYREELFGPVASVFIANTDEEAIYLANDTAYGLGASVWCSDEEKARAVAKDINSGMVYINQMVRSTPELPFGGINRSGYGRELSVFGITEFVNTKAVFA